MKAVAGLCVVWWTLLMGRTGGTEPSGGYCIGSQCFTVFQDPCDYETARSQCGDLGGHLMTVRSSVSHDVLNILLGNFTGRFWIGLRLTGSCPDAAAALNGFEWVTKDNESDFFNWASPFDSSCSSGRCVSVSQADEFRWTREPCAQHAAGFLCENRFSNACKSLPAAEGESVSYRTPMGFGGEDLLSLPPGTTAIRMPAETNYVCFGEQWLKAPWTCEVHKGGCEYKCATNPDKKPSCYCPPGQIINPANKVTCEVATEDPCLPLGCAHACYNKGDSWACMCEHGFNLAEDGRSCVDYNDCKDERQCPPGSFKCVNTPGGFRCVCQDGYSLSGAQCVDDDECMSAPCEHICTNTVGSYKCSCFEGYREDPHSPNKCTRHCGKQECPAECDPNDRYQCFCPVGYVSEERDDMTFCVDINECSSYYCDQGCENTFGSYVCSCSPGFTLVGTYRCVKSDDDADSDGSGATPTPDIPETSAVPHPEPTRQPSAVTVGGLVGIVLCTVFFIVLVVFLAQRILCGRGKTESADALKTRGDEAHGLRHVTSDT